MNTTYTAVIIEDLAEDLKLLQHWLSNHFPEIQVLGTAVGKDSGYVLLESLQPNLLFCDIELDEGSTSFDILARWQASGRPFTFEVIFMTAHPEQSYYTKAFDYEAIDYIVKPFGQPQLARAIDRAIKNTEQNHINQKYNSLIQLLQQENSVSQHLAIHLPNNKLRRLAIADIMYIEADTVCSIFHLASGETITAIRNLGEYRKVLELDHQFFSISHSLYLNMAYHSCYHHNKLTVELTTGKILHASRQGGQRFKAFLETTRPEMLKPQDPSEHLIQKLRRLLGL